MKKDPKKNQIGVNKGKYGPGISNDPGIKSAPQTPRTRKEGASGKPQHRPMDGLFESGPYGDTTTKRGWAIPDAKQETGLRGTGKGLTR